MNGSLLIWITLAIATFWSVGVYNRLMRIRARGMHALSAVDGHMRQYAELTRVHLAAIGALWRDADEVRGDWMQFLDCLDALEKASTEVRDAPLMRQTIIRLSVVYEDLQQCWARLRGGGVSHLYFRVPDNMHSQWEAITDKVQETRANLNQILSKYNEAIDQFPARLVAGVMNLEPTCLL